MERERTNDKEKLGMSLPASHAPYVYLQRCLMTEIGEVDEQHKQPISYHTLMITNQC